MQTGSSTQKAGSRLFGNSRGPLYDEFATRWFVKMAEITENRVRGHVERQGEPEDYHVFHTRKEGNLGLEVSVHVHKEESGELTYSFHLNANKYKYEKWAREHTYLMEGFMTFRVGPVIVAHPGRDSQPIRIAGKERPKPINIWEMEFGFLAEEGTDWFNLLQSSVTVCVSRNRNPEGPNSPAWLVHRTR